MVFCTCGVFSLQNLKHQQQRRGNFSASTFPVAHSSPSLSSKKKKSVIIGTDFHTARSGIVLLLLLLLFPGNSVLIRSEAASSGGAGSGGEVTIDMDSVHRDRQSQSQIMQQQVRTHPLP